MAQDKEDTYRTDEKETIDTGSNLPHGDGTVSDEDVNRIDDQGEGKPIGQDHSTENRENQMPTSGVGAFQDSNQQITSGIAHIEDDEQE